MLTGLVIQMFGFLLVIPTKEEKRKMEEKRRKRKEKRRKRIDEQPLSGV